MLKFHTNQAAEPLKQWVTGSIPHTAKFIPRTDDSHCYKIHCSLNPDQCFDSGCVRKQPVAKKELCEENCPKEDP